MNLRNALLVCCGFLVTGLPAGAPVFELTSPDAAVLGREERVLTADEDTLYEIAQRFSLGSEEIIRVNPGVDPWLPRGGRSIVIPGERYDQAAKPMIDYFLAFEESCNRFPGFSYEVQGVYQVAENDRIRFYTYVVKE